MSTTTTIKLDPAGLQRAAVTLARTRVVPLARELLREARDRTPVDTGRLRDSMWAAVFADGRRVWSDGPAPEGPQQRRGIELLVGNDTPYSSLVHDGTVDTEQHPFLAEALAIVRPKLAAIMAQGEGT